MGSAHDSNHPIRIFLVEDSSIIRENLIDLLHEATPVAIVGSADSEAAAIDWLTQRHDECDLVIIDIFLSKGNGLGVLKALTPLGSEPKRIVLSNQATPEVRAKCVELGATAVFDKSNELAEMLAWLTRLARSGLGVAASPT